MPTIVKWLQCLNSWLWGFLLILLPITSMPLVVKLVRSDTVAAPSGIILVVLIILWLLPYLLKKLPSQNQPFHYLCLLVLYCWQQFFHIFMPFLPISHTALFTKA